jgi:translation initiation factor IF-3
LIGYDGEQLGVTAIDKALKLSEEIGLDLVEISPDANPPVCKIMDFGKYAESTGSTAKSDTYCCERDATSTKYRTT